jgi:hypothetical protein
MEQKKMSPKTKWILAAAALGALIACMKAGDGMGLDTSGKVIPFCTAYPNDPSCKPDPCALPTSKACSTSMCEKDSSHAWCRQPLDCAANPAAQACVDSCALHPALAWCAIKLDCGATPTAKACVDSCAAHPTLAWCKVDCNVTPSDTSCLSKTKFSQVWPLLQSYTCPTCHSGTGAGALNGKLNMATQDSAYANLINKLVTNQTMAAGWKRVVPGLPDSSMLYFKLSLTSDPIRLPNGKNYLSPMPYQLPPISKSDLAVIKKWIQDGALK